MRMNDSRKLVSSGSLLGKITRCTRSTSIAMTAIRARVGRSSSVAVTISTDGEAIANRVLGKLGWMGEMRSKIKLRMRLKKDSKKSRCF